MSKMLFVIAQPLTQDYNEFFDLVIPRLAPSASCLDVLVSSIIEDTAQLNFVLLTLYTQIRHKLILANFTYSFEIDIHVNAQLNFQLCDYQIFYPWKENVPSALRRCNMTGVQTLPSHITKTVDNSASMGYHTSAVVAVGGTFDHLHDGHKILLLMAAFASKQTVIIGVTGLELLQNKKYASALQSLDMRMNKTCTFLRKILQPGQQFRIYQINDVCGPTGYIPCIDSLVISEETAQGAAYVNETRIQRGFSPLQVVCVKVIGLNGPSNCNSWDGKLSSTELRRLELELLKLL
ncbi:pantetheine-phosphate adenylyltransferase [Metschnikowia aff. pulcherrima]|uniref:Pantetheine-phosphate adenylyltransferase n=1 Tax=Metschnikowia aff. pulcherrima TaxID=2163413 RepID=A0A4P6XLK3_9ASCO|nr:pantetheine-phosphate adenylyltransferase [Metschnikowia aff. pulcherrima]